jgi:hypothetical protein
MDELKYKVAIDTDRMSQQILLILKQYRHL